MQLAKVERDWQSLSIQQDVQKEQIEATIASRVAGKRVVFRMFIFNYVWRLVGTIYVLQILFQSAVCRI